MSGYWMDNNSQSWYGQPNDGQQQDWSQYSYKQENASNTSNAYSYYAQQTTSGQNYGNSMFIPSQQPSAPTEDFENEPPLLEELGINFSHIKEKTLAVLNPVGNVAPDVVADQDLAGPLVFCLLFGGSLLLHGKLTFGYIYGIGGLGCVGMYALLNLMAAEKGISFTCTASVLGYCLLPMALLSMLTAVLSFQGILGAVIAAAAVLWCSISSSKLFVTTLAVERQRFLIAYPCILLYSVFALLAIF